MASPMTMYDCKALIVACAAIAAATSAIAQQAAGVPAGTSGLPVPRFVSLKADRVNMRSGPGTEYPAQWEFHRAGLPVEVIKEYGTWRQVRDSEGTSGWVIAGLLSGRRTALVVPWEVRRGAKPPEIAVKSDDDERSKDAGRVEAGVIANIRSCDGRWCEVVIGEVEGYLEQKRLWGVYPNEKIK